MTLLCFICTNKALAITDGQEYPIVNGLEIKNLWIQDRVHSPNDWISKPYCNTLARTAVLSDGYIYIARSNAKTVIQGTDTLTQSVVYKVNATNGMLVKELPLTLNGEIYGGTTLSANNVGVDNFGHLYVSPFSNELMTQHTIFLLNGETGELTWIAELDKEDATFRIDYVDVIGDITREKAECNIMGAGGSSNYIYRWHANQGGNFEGGFHGMPYLEIEKFYPETVTNWGYAPVAKMVLGSNDDFSGEQFYIDGFSTTPILYDLNGTMVSSFEEVDPAFWPMDVGGNGVCEFTLDERKFIVYVAAQYFGYDENTGQNKACQVYICELGEDMTMSNMQRYWMVPDALGTISDGGTRVQSINVEYGTDEDGNEFVTLLIFKCYNGMAVYKISKYDFVSEDYFEVDGIYYKKNLSNKNVSIVSRIDGRKYEGHIIIPASVTYQGETYEVTEIADNAFAGCTELNSLAILGSLQRIGNNAFDGTNISCLYLGNVVTSICNLGINPNVIYSYSSTPPACDEFSFTGYNGTLHVPSSSVAAYFTADYWCNFAQITGDAVEPLDVSISQDSIDLLKGNQCQLTAAVSPANATPKTISWVSTNNSVARVINGIVTAVSVGECDVIATCVGKQDICHVTVTEIEPTTIVLNQDTAVIEVNHQLTLTATVLPDSATYNTVTWSSTDESIATVNDGVVTAQKAGTCDIIARCRDLTATCHVTVVNQTIVISLDEEEIELLPNHIITLTPSASPVMPQGFTVTSSDPTVAAARVVNGKVQVVGIKEGTTTITVGAVDGTAVPATCFVTVYTERGDVNMDGFINISDVTDMIDYLLGAEMTDFKGDNADLNGDGKISISDVTDLIDYILSGKWPWTPLPTTYSIIFDATIDVGNGSSMASEFTIEKDGITIHVEQGVANGIHYRFYKNRKVTITSTIGDITSIVFDCIGADNDPYGSGGFTSQPGVYEPIGHQGIWTNSGVSQVVFTATNFQVRATKITVTVASNTELFAPSINPISGTYYEPVEVYMTCLNGDAKIYYTTDGSSPTVNSTLYTAPFTIPFELGNTVVKAISAKDGKISEVTTASYTFAERPPFGWANMYETPDNTEVTFTYPSIVLWQSGNTIYCKDETGYGVVYGNTGQAYLIGDIIPEGFGGRKTTYHTKPELVNPTGFQPATTYVEVNPDVITPAQVGNAFWAHYVLLEDVKINPTISNSGTFTDANGNSCTYFTGTFGVPVPDDGGNHDVWGIVAAYKPSNGDLEFQILPISFGTGPCHSGPARQNWQW